MFDLEYVARLAAELRIVERAVQSARTARDSAEHELVTAQAMRDRIMAALRLTASTTEIRFDSVVPTKIDELLRLIEPAPEPPEPRA
jgi:hypothetical protein